MDKKDFIFSLPQLKEYLSQKGYDLDRVGLFAAKERHHFFMLIPKFYLDLIDWYDLDDPLRKQVVTSNLEEKIYNYELQDPIGDHTHEPVPGIVHRYPDRCLLMLTNICAVHCRFCFRKNLLDTNKADYDNALRYIQEHKELREIILSGGDPFMLTDYFLEKVIHDLNNIKHVKIIRFHTRTPPVFPARITPEFLRIISEAKGLTIAIHINHPREITPAFIETVERFKDVDATILSQTVLMKDINDSEETLKNLFVRLSEIGVKPYYLHHLDMAQGTHHFRISLRDGKKIYHQLRGNISGHAVPEYVLDTPGGHGKIPVMWFREVEKGTYEAENYQGRTIRYKDPVEQNIMSVETK